MSDDFTLRVKRFEPTDVRLGRHVCHDSRSLQYRFRRAASPRKLASVRHNVRLPIMDQGQVGSCTGHAGTAALGSDAFWPAASSVLLGADAQAAHVYAVGLYSAATELDPWPGAYEPDDTGSDGLSVAKALHQRGLISGYQHATTLQDALAALSERVVMIGSSWWSGMFYPASDGKLTISGQVEGGHEYALDEIDAKQERAYLRNSWGTGWGVQGRAYLTFDDLGRLLADDGDCTVLVPLTQPAPVPTPEPPKPAPADDRALVAALTRWLHTSAGPSYLRKEALEWMKGR